MVKEFVYELMKQLKLPRHRRMREVLSQTANKAVRANFTNCRLGLSDQALQQVDWSLGAEAIGQMYRNEEWEIMKSD